MSSAGFGTDNELSSMGRRDLVRSAAAIMGLALVLPASRLLAVASSPASTAGSVATKAAIGYWPQGSIASNNPVDVIVDGATVASSPGTYELRVLDVSTDVSLALDAQYPGGAHHRFWQAWIEGRMLQRSPTSAIRWAAENGNPLQLEVSAGGSTSSTRVPAKPGTYVLAVGRGNPPPAWKQLALRPREPGSTKDMLLVERAGGKAVVFPHMLFSVQQIGTQHVG